MKICWDNLNKLEVIKDVSGGLTFKKGHSYYVESESKCLFCGEPFLRVKYPLNTERQFCCTSCARSYLVIINAKIIPGVMFGKWEVIKMTEERPFGNIGYLCRCVCGTERVVDSASLRRGTSTSCGCTLVQRNKDRAIDLVGYESENYKVIAKSVSKDSGIMWKCLCRCGNYFYASASHIKNNSIKSCGCIRNKYGTYKPIAELGITPYEAYKDSFGNIEKISYKVHEEYGINVLLVRCAYCGKLYMPSISAVKLRLNCIEGKNAGEGRFYCSDNCKAACPIFKRILWPKGFKKATSREVQPQLRQMVLARDNYECQICGKNQQEAQLHCHHIEGIHHNPIESADIDICITLCKACHKKVHKLPGCSYYDFRCIK